MVNNNVVDKRVQEDHVKSNAPVFKAKTANFIAALRDQKVSNLFYPETIAWSSRAHTKFRRTLISKSKLENDQV